MSLQARTSARQLIYYMNDIHMILISITFLMHVSALRNNHP